MDWWDDQFWIWIWIDLIWFWFVWLVKSDLLTVYWWWMLVHAESCWRLAGGWSLLVIVGHVLFLLVIVWYHLVFFVGYTVTYCQCLLIVGGVTCWANCFLLVYCEPFMVNQKQTSVAKRIRINLNDDRWLPFPSIYISFVGPWKPSILSKYQSSVMDCCWCCCCW